jgi:hypothetical protein
MISKLSWLKRLKDGFKSQPTDSESFSRFLIKNTINRKYLLIATAGIFIQFIVFKLCYPFGDFFSDSYTYINAASHHHNISFRPIGYSRFLELIHLMTTSDTVVVLIQYLVIQAGGLLLFFTLRYFFPLGKTISNVLFALLLFNPILLYISNCICSDALFVGLSLAWVSTLVWIVNRPKWVQLIPLAGLLFIIFTLRYAALFLPVVAVWAFWYSPRNWLFKLAGIALIILPLFIEIQRIRHITEKETGTAVFSAFGGWMSANNVLHMYPYIEVADTDLPSTECMILNKIVKKYFDSLPESERPYPGLRFDWLWANNSPLKAYRNMVEMRTKDGNYFTSWHAVAPVFSQYSSQLIRQHPAAFAKYYLLPNVTYYCLPPIESLIIYNTGADSVDATASNWFHYKSVRVSSIGKKIQGSILQPMPYWFLLINITFCVSMVLVFIRRKRYTLSPALERTLVLAGGFWMINFGFSIYAAPIVLRFQLLPMIALTVFTAVLIDTITTHDRNKPASTM